MKSDIKPKEAGWGAEVEIVRVIDADTIEIKITRTANLRLRGIDAPERKTELGLEASNYVKELLTLNKKVFIFVPSNNSEKLMDINSFQRIVGDLWIGEESLRDILIEKGYVKVNKRD